MRYEITYLEGNKVMVTDTVQKDNYYGKVVNGKAVANSWLAMTQISKALWEIKESC
ncbi:hypothetical protein OKW24_005730 [Peribacillus simplex]|uniref:hypothetical protein n=1 Tax=Peribacillus simplex TaxID=1478 RepID=UPI0024E2276E|nr:hypothetical protein [Peribacillus simplex]MDF9763834.1 hypothetical protein [Peribacillus simplex]